MDLRNFIERLDGAGRLRTIWEPMDWNLQIGALTRSEKSPLLFENIVGYPGSRVFTNGLVDPNCIAMALDIPAEAGKLRQEGAKRIKNPLKPVLVDSGPVMENFSNSDLDFYRFPIPHWHPQDAGRYIGTWHLNITKDPETGKRNLGVYRMQTLSPKQATVSASPRSHLAQHLAKAEAKGTGLEVAVVIGAGEALIIAASAACGFGVDEFELAGSLQNEPVELVKCRTIDHEAPAHAEILLEGFIHPGVRVQDGPYFDYTGLPSVNNTAFLFEAKAISFRSNPIFRGTSIGQPGAEDHQIFAFLAGLGLVDFHGVPSKQWVQNQLLKMGMFRPFQIAGALKSRVRQAFR